MARVERGEFEKGMALLHGGYDRPCTEAKLASYWQSLGKMSAGDFQRAIEFCLSEDAPEKLPTHQALWRIAKQLRPARQDGRLAPIVPDMDEWEAKAARWFGNYIGRVVRLRTARYGQCSWTFEGGIVIGQSMLERVMLLVKAKNEWIGAMRMDPKRTAEEAVRLWNELIAEAECTIDELVAEEKAEVAT